MSTPPLPSAICVYDFQIQQPLRTGLGVPRTRAQSVDDTEGCNSVS